MKAHVSESKKQEVKRLISLLQSESNIGVIDLTNLPSAQFQKIKHKLKKDLKVRVSKKRLIKLAIENIKSSKPGIEKLEEYLDKCMPALLFTNKDAFKVSKTLDKNKSASLAKPGQIAPKDLVIPEGPTSFAPGPIIGELGQAGIKAAIEGGKVVIKKETVLVKKGEVITQKQSDMLAKFGIQPMEIGLNIVAFYQNGDLFDAEVLSIDDKEYINRIKVAAQEAINLAIYSAYPTKETVEILLQKAERESLALNSKVPQEIEEEIKKEESSQQEQNQEESEPKTTKSEQGNYTEEAAKKAEELINKLKDGHIGG